MTEKNLLSFHLGTDILKYQKVNVFKDQACNW